MSLVQSSSFLRRVLLVDAVSCAGMGLLLVAFATPVAALLNLPAGLLVQAGIVLLPFAAFVAYLASRAAVRTGAVWVVIAVNAVWVAESFVLLALDSIEANVFGQGFVVGQALFVAALSVLEYVGLRRSPAAAIA